MELEPFSRTQLVAFQGASLPQLLAEQATVQPDAAAIICADQEMTFRELAESSAHLADRLQAAEIGVDDCVGLFVEPSAELVVGVWGVLTAGAAYLPLSPEYPDERLRYMIEDSRTGVIITQSHLVERVQELAPRTTRVIELSAGATPAVATSHVPPPLPTSLAYVIYTSGSTGRPKGVMIEHRSILSQMRWLHECAGLRTGSRVLQKTPSSFDAAQWEILAPAVGAHVVMGEPGIYRDVDALIATIINAQVTTLQCVPTLLQALLDTEEFRRCTSLRYVFSGGETLSTQLARAFSDALPRVFLINLYGPTECTINATACLVDPATLDRSRGTVSIGAPVDNTQCFVLDESLDPVDIGQRGELYIGGTQLARGYLNRPEQTEEKFLRSPFAPAERLYRTGDLVEWNPDGTLQFHGRTDNQVKLRGHRVELDEISTAIEEHTWVKRSAAVVRNGSAGQQLVAFVELNPKEAALMDQGKHGSHHQSKASRVQVKAQLSGAGLRKADPSGSRAELLLPGKLETARQRRRAFERKSYRFFDGDKVSEERLLNFLARRGPSSKRCDLESLTLAELGEILRSFGQFHSNERLLPKYAYASPGALYATQLYVEIVGFEFIEPGTYYYHPVHHSLALVAAIEPDPVARLSVHFVGKQDAIQPVYRNNIQEVLELEAGHMVGLFEDVLPDHGLRIAPSTYQPAILDRIGADEADVYLGSFSVVPNDGHRWDPDIKVYVQVNPGGIDGMSSGQYEHRNGRLEHVSNEVVQAKHVIAINQQVYARSSFGISLATVVEDDWLAYIALGATVHRLQANQCDIGLMSSGYSSKSGNPLPSARRIDDILLGLQVKAQASYFVVGGRVSEAQLASEGMLEDAVHMKGPAEIIKDELSQLLPRHMIPDRISVLDHLPSTANGKLDLKALEAQESTRLNENSAGHVAAVTRTERWLVSAWQACLRRERVSTDEDFFGAGGNSLMAVSLINKIDLDLGVRIPYQAIFQTPRLADLAARVDRDATETVSRLAPLQSRPGRPVFCWPGLGGYPMNLRHLADGTHLDRRFYGVQALGLNAGEEPCSTISEMASADVAEIRRVQPEGPYTLIGYSFGARVAFETAWQLERLGEEVDNLLLVCPGNPAVHSDEPAKRREANFESPAYVKILYSVFAGKTTGPELDHCLAAARDENRFVSFIQARFPSLDGDTIRRITRLVARTFEFDYTFHELTQRYIKAPIAIYKARGDDYSFIEAETEYSAAPPTVHELAGDHYSVLKVDGVGELATAVTALLSPPITSVRRQHAARPAARPFPHHQYAQPRSQSCHT